MTAMTALELETTYLGLDGAGGVTPMPVGPDFWATIGDNPHAGGTLVGVSPTAEGAWAHWEMHPRGDEVLVLLEGRMRMVFERASGDQMHDLGPGSMLIVPAGVWHRAVSQDGVRMLFLTYGAGTEQRPAAPES
jgi:mannose-6-phosphate isomerase-like protein (cupin superfamily)